MVKKQRVVKEMANIQERRSKDGRLIFYSICVHRGRGPDGKQLKPWTATFEVSPTWTEKSAKKKAEAFAATFEKECREGVVSDSRFQPEQIADICDALKAEPLKWKVIAHLFLITGARRGEIMGLKWDDVDFEQNRIRIYNNLLYRSDCGIYEDAPKTTMSGRFAALPKETMRLLQQYKAWILCLLSHRWNGGWTRGDRHKSLHPIPAPYLCCLYMEYST